MSLPLWMVETAEQFWRDAGRANELHPRDLEAAIANSVDLAVLEMENLSLDKIRKELERRHIPIPLAVQDRPVRGCLIATKGVGFAFIEKRDSPEERRFTLAHELAHFLRDHRFYRERARKILGQRGIEIFDGKSPPTVKEELEAILRGLWLRPNIHLLEREQEQLFEIRRVEADADRLALEILVPEKEIDSMLRHFGEQRIVSQLADRFRLPRWAAEYLAESSRQPPSALFQRLMDCLDES